VGGCNCSLWNRHSDTTQWLKFAISTRRGLLITRPTLSSYDPHPLPPAPAALVTRAQLRPAASSAQARYSREIEKAHKGRDGVTWALCLATVRRSGLWAMVPELYPYYRAPL
jgi:hypothetical protein